MCVVSMVTQHYFDKYPNPNLISPSIYKDIEELIRKSKEYDKVTGQPDCQEFDKANWWKRVQEYQDQQSFKWVPNPYITLSSHRPNTSVFDTPPETR